MFWYEHHVLHGPVCPERLFLARMGFDQVSAERNAALT